MRSATAATVMFLAALGGAATAGRADTLLKGATGTNPIPQPNVKVTGIADGALSYTTATGTPRSAPLGDVQRLTVDGQSDLNAAEDAYAAPDMATALTKYSAILNGTGTDWIKTRAAQRLAEVGRAQHRYDVQVAAYAQLVKAGEATLASTARPAAPAAGDPTLDAAQSALTRAMGSVPAAKRTPLLGVQLDIARAKGDKAGVASALQQMQASGGDMTESDRAMLALASAGVKLDNKQYADAATAITVNKGMFTDPPQQVDALYILAQAKDGSGPTTQDGLKDAALAYMRVVAFGDALPDRPHGAESLLRAGQLLEKLSDTTGALAAYQKVATDKAYAGSPAAVAEAKKAVARLKH